MTWNKLQVDRVNKPLYWISSIVIFFSIETQAMDRLTITPPNIPVPLAYFGIHNHRFHSIPERPALSFGSWRLWDAGVGWSQIQPQRDRWNFSRMDLALRIAAQEGYSVHMIFGRTPLWAAENPRANSFYGLGASSPPLSMSDFSNFVGVIGQRYADRIDAYEVWNEPASGGMFSGTVHQMVEMTQAVAEQVRAHDPSAKVVCPSPAKHESLIWFRRFVQAGGTKPCDIIGYHFYTDSDQPEDRLKLIDQVQQILLANGVLNKPIWDTESGISLATSSRANPEVATASAHMARWLILTWASGVERLYWYSWDHERLGFKVPGGSTHTKALQAFEKVQSWMLGSTFHSCKSSQILWTCDLSLANGQAASIQWTSDNSSVRVGVSTTARVESLLGDARRNDPNHIVVNGEPVLIVDAKAGIQGRPVASLPVSP